MAFLPIIMAAVSAVGAIASSNSQQAQLKGQEYAAEANATALKQQADSAGAVANANEDQQRKQARSVNADQRVAMSAAGTGLLSPTNQNLAVQSANNAEQDALNIRYGGILQAHGLMAQSQAEAYQGQMAKSQIAGVRASGYLNAFSSGMKAYSGAGGTFGSG
jgi:hypothetical protein